MCWQCLAHAEGLEQDEWGVLSLATKTEVVWEEFKVLTWPPNLPDLSHFKCSAKPELLHLPSSPKGWEAFRIWPLWQKDLIRWGLTSSLSGTGRIFC